MLFVSSVRARNMPGGYSVYIEAANMAEACEIAQAEADKEYGKGRGEIRDLTLLARKIRRKRR